MISIISIFITAFLGLIALVAKTKKDEKPGYFNKLTPFGFIVLILLLLALCNSLWLEYDKRRTASTKIMEDSLRERYKYSKDSAEYAFTINKLELQHQINLKKINDDSIRFMITLDHLETQLSRQNTTLGNTVVQLNRQQETIHQIHRNATVLDKVGVFAMLEYSFSEPEVNSFITELRKRVMPLVKRNYLNSVSNEARTYFTVTDDENHALIRMKIENDSIIITEMELYPESSFIPQGYGPGMNGADFLGEVKLSLNFFTKRPDNERIWPDLSLEACGWNPKDRSKKAPHTMDPSHVEPAAIALWVDYTNKIIQQRVFTTSIVRSNDGGKIVSVPDLKNATLVIRPGSSILRVNPKLTHLGILWGSNLSRYIVLKSEKLKWEPSGITIKKIQYAFDGTESPAF